MAANPQVLELLEEMLDSGKTPEEVCRDCPNLLPEVRERWKAFCRIDPEVGAWYPEPEREVFELVRIQGLTQAEAATVVGVSERTVQRRLNRARLLLVEQLEDLRPATSSEPALPPGDTPAP